MEWGLPYGPCVPPTDLELERRRALGRRIRETREALNLSQVELAARSGVDRSYLGGIERGARRPTVDMLWQLADVLQVTPAVFFTKSL